MLDLLRPRARGDEQRVGGVDHDEVVDAEQGHEPAGRRHDDAGRVAAEHQPGLAEHLQAALAGRQHRGERVEVADVVPPEPARDDGDPAGCGGGLGDGVVERDLRQPGPHLLHDRRAVGGVPRGAEPAQLPAERGLVLVEHVEHDRGAGHEHAGVPAVLAARDVLGGGLGVGLLAELLHDQRGRRALDAQRRAGPHVPEAGGRVGGFDADRHQPAGLRGRDRLVHRLGEHRVVPDHVVGRERAEHGLRVAGVQHRGGQPDRGGGLARCGLDQQVAHRQPRQLLGDRGLVGDAGDDADTLGQRRQPVPGALQQRAAGAGEVVQELRLPRA
ncbi:hypothetical protein GCM10025868_34970 [Angustibacter aerolatus]|uniref:Uncharacterized protein n=1 Tax=Angustibacter aerolatus TaxID=1162965 RepID=A0ABQ6JN23_9ACTN|nr:hypothetical protein GCM10025868_34970 [Angustibacter aerolatus]